jgi:hypothetical protein
VFADDDEKIRIPGVHARWPGVLLFALGLGAAALYQADRTGKVHVRELADSWIKPAHLGPDVALTPRADHRQREPSIARGIYAAEPTREANGALALRAVPEVDNPDSADSDPRAAPISEAERLRRIAAYRDYLASQGLTPLREVLQPTPQMPAPDAPPAEPPTSNPY